MTLKGDQLWALLPTGKLRELDEARGRYITRNRFVLYALDRAIEEANSGTLRLEDKNKRKERTPQGAQEVRNSAPSGEVVASHGTSTEQQLANEREVGVSDVG